MKSFIKSFQIILSKLMDIENQEVNYCDDDNEYRAYCEVCDKLCFER